MRFPRDASRPRSAAFPPPARPDLCEHRRGAVRRRRSRGDRRHDRRAARARRARRPPLRRGSRARRGDQRARADDRGAGRAVQRPCAGGRFRTTSRTSLGAVLLAVKAHAHRSGARRDRAAARRGRLRRLAAERHQRAGDRRASSARSARSARSSTSARTTSAPGRIFLGGKGALYVGELDGRPSQRVERLVRRHPGREEATDAILGYLWAKEAYGAMLFATAVSDLSIADALAEPRYRHALRAARARRCSPRRRSRRGRSTASTPPTSTARSTASSSSTGARRRRTPASTATSPCASGRPRPRPCSRGPTGRSCGARSS